ncbi:MAG: glutamine amidotransferase [Spirochaetes bacterium]|nr:glutamine amidotransferase [Spirochaetota bacterium]
MISIYVYVLDTLADWELGYITSELNSGRFFKKDSQNLILKTVSYSKELVKTMGGITIIPDCVIEDISVSETSVLLLPGANTWNDPKHGAVIEKAGEFLSSGATVCAICGATAALADHGLLDTRHHASNGPGFLEMFCPGYKGQNFYIDMPSVKDNNLITAGSAGALLWAKHIIEHLGVFQSNTLESWCDYFNTGKPEHFYALMQTLPSGNEN